jgi:hypothetical protein
MAKKSFFEAVRRTAGMLAVSSIRQKQFSGVFMMKNRVVLFLVLAGLFFLTSEIYAGEWDFYAGEPEVIFFGNARTETSALENGMTFSEIGNSLINELVGKGYYKLSKLPNDLSSLVWSALNQYTLEDGDVFMVWAGYTWTSPKQFGLVLKITDNGKSFTYYGVRCL